jgi:hypothetical protein
VDQTTFLTTVYVLITDECTLPVEAPRPGRRPALARAELLTLALFGQWYPFGGERAFYRWAHAHLLPFFPTLPSRPQYNRLLRHWADALVAVGLQIAPRLARLYSILDTFGVAVRNKQRRGAGWLAGQAAIGYCSRLGWFEGIRFLSVVGSSGAITGFALAPGNAGERAEAEALLAARAYPRPDAPMAGAYTDEPYLADAGFFGQACMARWRELYGAQVIAPPEKNTSMAWSAPVRRQHAGLRQIVESVHDRLLNTFGLAQERPHTFAGFYARVAAKVALHNLCLWLNQRKGRPLLAFADLIDW